MIGPVQSHDVWRQSRGTTGVLKWEGFVENVGFEPAVKECTSNGCLELWWWKRWVDKWMRRWIETELMRLMKWIWKLIPKMRWCISDQAICDFQWEGGWWAVLLLLGIYPKISGFFIEPWDLGIFVQPCVKIFILARPMLSCSVLPSVCVSITFVNSVIMNIRIFNFFSPSCSQAILVFQYQTTWQYSDYREYRWG